MRASTLRLGRDLGIVLALVWVGVVASGILGDLAPGFDAHAYWATRSGDMYGQAQLGSRDAYLYSPAFAQALAPITALPWTAFITLWSALIMAAYLWLAGPLAVPLLFVFPVAFEIHEANIHILLAAMLVVAWRWPAAWAFGLLTKVTPGIGLVWYAARREWRALAIALGATAAITGASFALAPDAWRTWLSLLTQSNAVAPTTFYLPVPLLPRLIGATALVGWGAITDRRWTVPVAVVLALPVVWLNGVTVLLALLPGLRRRFGLEVSPLPRRRAPMLAPAGTGLPGAS